MTDKEKLEKVKTFVQESRTLLASLEYPEADDVAKYEHLVCNAADGLDSAVGYVLDAIDLAK